MKTLKKFFLPLFLILALTACGDKVSVPESEEHVAKKGALKAEDIRKPEDEKSDSSAAIMTDQKQVLNTLVGDTYWEAYMVESAGEKTDLPSDENSMDLLLRENGSAKFRDVIDGTVLVDDGLLYMTWNLTDDQGVDIYMEGYEEPWMSATIDGEEMCMVYMGETVYLKKVKLPEETGELYHPAELEGVWLLESGEVEGDVWEAQPGQLESMVFESVLIDGSLQLIAGAEKKNYWEDSLQSDYEMASTTILDEPIYSGCGNEIWSVRVGEESEVNEEGYPLETETYVTLLDENTMLRKLYYIFDGGPGVSYQTFRRIIPSTAECYFTSSDLEGGDYECISYTDRNGKKTADVPEMKDFYVHLDVNSEMMVSWWDESIADRRSFVGTWLMGEGGVINLVSNQYDGEQEFTDTCWFAGAIRGVMATSPGMGEYDSEMYLYYDGGIIHLQHNIGSGGENFGGDYQDYRQNMDYLEENAFAAPEDTLLIIYGDDFLNMEEYGFLPINEISTAADSRQILITAVLDNTYIWYEDQDGYTAWAETLNAGESVILQIDVPENAKEYLWFNINDEAAYFYGIDQKNIALDDFMYVTK